MQAYIVPNIQHLPNGYTDLPWIILMRINISKWVASMTGGTHQKWRYTSSLYADYASRGKSIQRFHCPPPDCQDFHMCSDGSNTHLRQRGYLMYPLRQCLLESIQRKRCRRWSRRCIDQPPSLKYKYVNNEKGKQLRVSWPGRMLPNFQIG